MRKMKPLQKRLPDTELEVMLAIWSTEGAVSRAWLEEKLCDKGWNRNTFNTYLTRLLEKGVIACEKRGKSNYYTPLLSQKEYLDFENRTFLGKLYNHSVTQFFAALCRGEGISSQELDDLQKFLDEKKGTSK